MDALFARFTVGSGDVDMEDHAEAASLDGWESDSWSLAGAQATTRHPTPGASPAPVPADATMDFPRDQPERLTDRLVIDWDGHEVEFRAPKDALYSLGKWESFLEALMQYRREEFTAPFGAKQLVHVLYCWGVTMVPLRCVDPSGCEGATVPRPDVIAPPVPGQVWQELDPRIGFM